MVRIITYECTQCGSEIVVTEGSGTKLNPIYCCGMEVAQVASAPKKPAKPKKKAAKKKVPEKKKPAKKKAKK